MCAIAVVNAVGDVIGVDGQILAGSTAPPEAPGFPTPRPFEEGANTTLVVVVTDGVLDKIVCNLLAQSAHDGLARRCGLRTPATTAIFAFACATGAVDVDLDRLRVVASDIVADAIRAAVSST